MSDAPTPQKAVALSHQRSQSEVPRVVASGQGTIAEQIIEIARTNGIKIREDAALVDILAALDIDSPIPVEAFAAVAEILIYVYRAEQRLNAPAPA